MPQCNPSTIKEKGGGEEAITPSFLNVDIDSLRGFHLGVSDMQTSCFNQNNTSLLLIFHYQPAPLLLNSLEYIMLYYI
jgi:hypothetical protein